MAGWQVWKSRFFGALFLGVVSTQAAWAVPVLSITATPDPAVQGSPVTLRVLITDVVDLYGYQFSLAFNPAVLQATSVTEGTFLAASGPTFFGGGTINNTTGLISFTFDSLIGTVPGVTGSGLLTAINLNVISSGSSALTFSDVLFLDSEDVMLAVQVQNRVLQAVVVPEPAPLMLLGAGLAALALRRRRAA